MARGHLRAVALPVGGGGSGEEGMTKVGGDCCVVYLKGGPINYLYISKRRRC